MNILLTSAGRRSYLVKYFKEALAGDGLVHAGNSVFSAALQAADVAVITPLIYDSSYIDFLIDYCSKNRITVILSFFDVDLPILAKSKDRFKKEGINVVVSDYEVIQICNDKWRTHNWLLEHKIATPRTYLKLDKVEKVLAEGQLVFPIIIKPRWGMGSISIYDAENREELKIFYEKAKREIFRSYLSYESDFDRENCIIFQEKITGQEYGLDVVNDLGGNYVTTFVKKKLSMRAGETDNAVTVLNGDFEKLGSNISIELQHIANLDLDCFFYNQEIYVLEMNCRFGGGYPFSHLAGANLPFAIIKWLRGESVEKTLLEINYGVEGLKDINPITLNKNK